MDKDKAGKGDYIEKIVRRYFDFVQASQISQHGELPFSTSEIEDAARELLYLDGLKIRYPAGVHAMYLKVPRAEALRGGEPAECLEGEQYRCWRSMNAELNVVPGRCQRRRIS